jgi:hypothetical protein
MKYCAMYLRSSNFLDFHCKIICLKISIIKPILKILFIYAIPLRSGVRALYRQTETISKHKN